MSVLACVLALAASAGRAEARGLPAAREGGQEPKLFDFHSGFWMNLHTYLHALVRAGSPIVEALPEAATADERVQWNAALAAYRERYGKRSLLFDNELVQVGGQISAAASRPSLEGSDVPSEYRALLESAAPIYRRHRWPSHDAANKRFIARVQPLLARHGEPIASRIARTYGTTWPRSPVRVDVVHNVGPPGNAHTSIEPTHVTIAAEDPRHQGLAGLEMVFHEASHAWGPVLMKDVADAAKRLAVPEPRNLWHAVLFFNAGAITADVLRAAGIPDYRQYMEVNDVFATLRPVVAKHWPAFLAGETTREAAITAMVRELK